MAERTESMVSWVGSIRKVVSDQWRVRYIVLQTDHWPLATDHFLLSFNHFGNSEERSIRVGRVLQRDFLG